MLKFICVAFAAIHFFIEVESVHYTRWGRTTCNVGASILYTGYMAGALGGNSGSGAQFLCISDNPDFNNLVPNHQGGGALYGAEYVFNGGYSNNQPFSYANNNNQDLTFNKAPCVVCIRQDVQDVIMIPGKFGCPVDNMNLEYNGHLASAHYANYRTDWICLDQAPEAIPGRSGDVASVYVYPAEVWCPGGSASICPPYAEGNEVTCAVCSM